MKAIVILLSDFNNPKFKARFDQIVSLSVSVRIDKERDLVFFCYDSDITLSACSYSLFIGSILHRVTLI